MGQLATRLADDPMSTVNAFGELGNEGRELDLDCAKLGTLQEVIGDLQELLAGLKSRPAGNA